MTLSSQKLARFLLLLLLVIHEQADACLNAQETNQEGIVVCSLNVTIVRKANCSALVTEQYTIAPTKEKNFHRRIQRTPEDQAITDVTVRRISDNASIPNEKDDLEKNNHVFLDVLLHTTNTSVPFVLQLSYRMTNAFVRFKRKCRQTAGVPDERANIVRWNAFPSEQLSVAVSTQDPRARLSILENKNVEMNHSIVSGREVRIDANITSEIEIYVKETGTETCPKDLVCMDRQKSKSLDLWVLPMIMPVLVLEGFCHWWYKAKCGSDVEFDYDLEL